MRARNKTTITKLAAARKNCWFYGLSGQPLGSSDIYGSIAPTTVSDESLKKNLLFFCCFLSLSRSRSFPLFSQYDFLHAFFCHRQITSTHLYYTLLRSVTIHIYNIHIINSRYIHAPNTVLCIYQYGCL